MIRPPRRRRTPRRRCAACAARGHSVSVCSPRRRGSRRVRRATDVLVFVPMLIALVALAAAQPRSLRGSRDPGPGWRSRTGPSRCGDSSGRRGVWVAALGRRKPDPPPLDIAAQAVLALAFAIVAGAIAARIALGDWPSLASTLGRYAGDPTFPNVRLALAVALVGGQRSSGSAGRRLSHWILLLAAAAAAIGGTAHAVGCRGRVPDGILAGAAMRMAVGVSTGWRSVPDVTAALSELGVPTEGLARDERQRAGVVSLHARDAAGLALTVKVYGRDAYDNELLVKLWRDAHVPRERPARSASAARRRPSTRHSSRCSRARPVRRTGGRDGRRHHRRTRCSCSAPGARRSTKYSPEAVGDAHLRAAWAALGRAEEGEHRPRRHRPLRHPDHGRRGAADQFRRLDRDADAVAARVRRRPAPASTAAVVGVERALAVAVASAAPRGSGRAGPASCSRPRSACRCAAR